VHDAVAFELAGVPAVVLVTEVFEALSLQTAKQLGLTHYPPLVVPHPIFNRDEVWLQRHADGVVEQALASLTAAAARS
jgi:hypothetical protein